MLKNVKPDPDGVMSHREDGVLGVAVELYRDASGSNVTHRLSSKWPEQIRAVAESNYGNITVVMHTDHLPGYSDNHGVIFTFVPGKLDGTVGGHGEPLRSPVYQSRLTHYGTGNSALDDFTIRTNLNDAIELHRQLGRVIANAKRMSKKNKRKIIQQAA